MARIAKRIFKGMKFTKGGGLLGTIVTGLIGAIAWGIGSDLYHRVTRGSRKDAEPEPAEER